jgi:cytochrome c5
LRLRLSIVAAVVSVGFGACATAIPHLSQEQLTWAAQQWPGVDGAQLEHGRSLYVTRCSACHEAPPPSDVDLTEMVTEMAERAKLNREEQELVIRFIEASRSGPAALIAGHGAAADHGG